MWLFTRPRPAAHQPIFPMPPEERKKIGTDCIGSSCCCLAVRRGEGGSKMKWVVGGMVVLVLLCGLSQGATILDRMKGGMLRGEGTKKFVTMNNSMIYRTIEEGSIMRKQVGEKREELKREVVALLKQSRKEVANRVADGIVFFHVWKNKNTLQTLVFLLIIQTPANSFPSYDTQSLGSLHPLSLVFDSLIDSLLDNLKREDEKPLIEMQVVHVEYDNSKGAITIIAYALVPPKEEEEVHVAAEKLANEKDGNPVSVMNYIYPSIFDKSGHVTVTELIDAGARKLELPTLPTH